ncbi:MAG: tRNA-dihydrouridine synthase [Clostridia bacterium]|nr:tRNA-dihydrouridine synthase [Clostridia bacterium]
MPYKIPAFSDVFFAPVAGYSDVGFRTLCARYGAGLTFTEMVSAKALHHNNGTTESLLVVGKEERACGVQLFGHEADIIAEAVASDRLKNFPIIDINMGCPVPKIVNNGEGSALMKTPEKIYEIVKAAVDAAGKRPVSVKMRAGFFAGEKNAVECALAAQEGGASMVTVHGRTREQYYAGSADLGIIGEVKSALDIPVCGNGDVTDRTSYLKMKDTGAGFVMVARAAFGRPYIFAEILEKPYEFDIKEAIFEHISWLSHLPERVVVNSMKKHVSFYVKGRPGHKNLKTEIFAAENMAQLLCAIEKI